MRPIDLNADLGEGFSSDEALLEIISSASVCSGHYAGNPQMTKAISNRARQRGVRVGWHVGFPDRKNFGRKLLEEGVPEDWVESVVDQIREAHRFAYVKPHGALYHWLATYEPRHDAIWDALELMEKPLMGLPGTDHEVQCKCRGLRFISEGFAERRYTPDLRLVPRSRPDAVLSDLDSICAQAVVLAEYVESICIHGDRSDAVEIAIAVRAALGEAGYTVSA